MLATNRTAVKNFIISNDLYLIPLQSIKDGKCTCSDIECSSPGKHPLLPYSWKRIATNDAQRISDWLAKSNVNYGIATGRISKTSGLYLIVVDVDTPDHEILTKLPKTTFHYRTGNGGWHYWFWSQYPIPNSASKIAPQVDIRGVGGYVVIPPSLHISGGNYVADFNTNIEVCDKSMYDLIFSKAKKVTLSKFSRKEQNNNFVLSNVLVNFDTKEENLSQIQLWSKGNVGEIRTLLTTGHKIPAGIRNVMLHRLLSSDRAKGLNKTKLVLEAQKYKTLCEQGSSISKKELMLIVNQVAKYPAHNTSYEKVNDQYFFVMARAGKPIDAIEQTMIKELDQQFFSKLLNTEKHYGNSIITLIEARNKLIGDKVSLYSQYPQHLFAAKLKSLGFERYRTSKGNFWNCCFEPNS